MSEEILTGYSKIIEALTEQGRWQAERIRGLEAALAKSEEAQTNLCARWLWAYALAQQYKRDYLEAREVAAGHKKSCADALARSLEATEECLRMGAEIERLREGLRHCCSHICGYGPYPHPCKGCKVHEVTEGSGE